MSEEQTRDTWEQIEILLQQSDGEALQIYRATLPPGHSYTAGALTNLGRALLELNRAQEAEATLQDALADFVLVEAAGQIARHGFFDQQVRIWSGAGSLLATSTQLARYDVAPS